MANDAQMPDVLPCPFCGAGPTVSIQNASFSGVEALYWHGLHFVNCGACGAEGAKEEDRSAAITAWNRRDLCASGGVAEMTDTRELVERLKVVARCGTDSTMRHSAYAFMAQDPEGDYVTYSAYAALSERNRALVEENARLHAAMLVFGAYLLEKGETFRTGEGAELVDAYSAALTPAPDAPQPAGEVVPVAWMLRDMEGVICAFTTKHADPVETNWTPLYAHPPQPPVTVEAAAVAALSAYQQADMDGTMVLVSRQAIEECLPALRALKGGA